MHAVHTNRNCMENPVVIIFSADDYTKVVFNQITILMSTAHRMFLKSQTNERTTLSKV